MQVHFRAFNTVSNETVVGAADTPPTDLVEAIEIVSTVGLTRDSDGVDRLGEDSSEVAWGAFETTVLLVLLSTDCDDSRVTLGFRS